MFFFIVLIAGALGYTAWVISSYFSSHRSVWFVVCFWLLVFIAGYLFRIIFLV